VCPLPPDVPDDAQRNGENLFFPGDTVEYTCLNSAFTIENNVAICENNGIWTPNTINSCVQISKQILSVCLMK